MTNDSNGSLRVSRKVSGDFVRSSLLYFYTGKAEWRSMISMETLMDVPEPLRRFVPSFETLFLGIQGEPDANLLQSEGPFGWLMTVLKRADTLDRFCLRIGVRDVRGSSEGSEGVGACCVGASVALSSLTGFLQAFYWGACGFRSDCC